MRVYGTDDHVLGNITNDPIFGTTNASMYFQVKPSFFPFFIAGNKESLVVDSAILILAYKGFYGDTSKPVKVQLKRISAATPLDAFKLYASNYPELYNLKTDQNLGETTVDFSKIGDSLITRFEASKNTIRIKLSKSFATQFLKDFDSNNAYRSDTTLRAYFPGFALSADESANKNVLLKINLLDTNTKLALYYNTNSTASNATSERDTAVVNFKFSIYSNGDVNFINDTASRSYFNPIVTTFPYVQAFVGQSIGPGVRTSVLGWNVNPDNGFVWRWFAYNTNYTTNSGPGYDHTTGVAGGSTASAANPGSPIKKPFFSMAWEFFKLLILYLILYNLIEG
jgi:hypothetical protein